MLSPQIYRIAADILGEVLPISGINIGETGTISRLKSVSLSVPKILYIELSLKVIQNWEVI